MHWHDLLKKNLPELTDKELSDHISDIKKYRIEETNCLSLSANECNTFLSLTHAEQNRRSSTRLAKTAIWISIVSVVLTAIGVLAGIVV